MNVKPHTGGLPHVFGYRDAGLYNADPGVPVPNANAPAPRIRSKVESGGMRVAPVIVVVDDAATPTVGAGV
jgi:hypothetical protein